MTEAIARGARTRRRIGVALPLLAALVSCIHQSVSAHDISRSESRLAIAGHSVVATLTMNLADFHTMPDVDRNRDGAVSYEELDAAIDRIYAAVRSHFIVRAPDAPVRTSLDRYALLPGNLLRMEIVYTFPTDVGSISVESTLDGITQPDHRHLTSAIVGGAVHEAVLDARTPSATFETGGGAYLRTIASFVRLGIEHIFTGYDHLAFLVGLLIATVTFRSLVKIITAFTVAHSITLALATFDAIVLPVRLTESLIAVTIAYVALENLLREAPLGRHRLTFAFGLIHGFGFSSVLREMQLPRAGLALSLVSFNTGVEIGQVAFVSIVFPLMLYVARTRWRDRVRPVVSCGVVVLAAYWFVQRAFLN